MKDTAVLRLSGVIPDTTHARLPAFQGTRRRNYRMPVSDVGYWERSVLRLHYARRSRAGSRCFSGRTRRRLRRVDRLDVLAPPSTGTSESACCRETRVTALRGWPNAPDDVVSGVVVGHGIANDRALGNGSGLGEDVPATGTVSVGDVRATPSGRDRRPELGAEHVVRRADHVDGAGDRFADRCPRPFARVGELP
jgi:hypothetical protein